jgi:hypothetical protein
MIKSRTVRLVEHVACMGVMRCFYRTLMGKPGEKGPLERPRCRFQNNIKINLREVGWEVLDWIYQAQNKNKRRVLLAQ